jgi:antitoxin component of RelBE/YafQ-DinJ toxin-antitoxin module
MKKEYDFSAARRNPYAKRIKRQVTIRLDPTTIDYFKQLAAEIGIPYQTLINLYLRDCAASGRRLAMDWPSPPQSEPGSRNTPARRRRRSSERSSG